MRRRFLAAVVVGFALTVTLSLYAGEGAAPPKADVKAAPAGEGVAPAKAEAPKKAEPAVRPATPGTPAPGAKPGEPAEPAEPPKPPMDPVLAYFVNRGKDFLDIFNLKLALGDGSSFLVNVRATRFAQVGFGHFCGTKIGFEGPSAGIYGERRTDVGISVFYWSWIARKVAKDGITADAAKTNRFFGQVEDFKTSRPHEYWDLNRPWHTVGVTLSLPFLPGIEAELNPAEAVDFVLSFFGMKGLRVPPPFYKVKTGTEKEPGEKVPAPESIRWHGQEQDFERYD
jgi:hypothetical protein